MQYSSKQDYLGPLRMTAPDSKQKRTLKKMFHVENVTVRPPLRKNKLQDASTPQKKHFLQQNVSVTSGLRLPSSYQSQKLGKSINPLKNISTLMKNDQENLSKVNSIRIVKKSDQEYSSTLTDMIYRGTKYQEQKSISPAKLNETQQSWRVLGLNKSNIATPSFEKKQFFKTFSGNPITGLGYQCYDNHGRRRFNEENKTSLSPPPTIIKGGTLLVPQKLNKSTNIIKMHENKSQTFMRY